MPINFVAYTSEFTTDMDQLLVDLSNDESHKEKTFEQLYESTEIHKKIFDAACQYSQDLTLDFKEILNKESKYNLKKRFITSIVGDDEVNTTDSTAYAIVSTIVAPILSKIKRSIKDCGISKTIANYAEGWIVTPPSRESDYLAVSRRHAGTGVPFVLDIVKLKNLSAVRKQSKLDLDFESKYIRLNETVQWTDREWFTYDYHQMSLILASCIFDYRSSKSFPFLFKEEGGTGGCPPFNNLQTATGALHHYHRGKATTSILGIMLEATAIAQHKIKPQDTVYLKAVYAAQTGGRTWLEFENYYRSCIKGKNRLELNEMVRSLNDLEEVPQELQNCGVAINSDDPQLGVAISHLRSTGLIMTELDVRVLIASNLKFTSLTGEVEMKTILQDIEERKTRERRNPLLTLARMQDQSDKIFEKSDEYDSQQISLIMNDYYKEKTCGRYQTSFFYADMLRIFKTEDVLQHLKTKTNFVRTDIVSQMQISKYVDFNAHIFMKTLENKRKVDFINSKPLIELLREPFPDGIGPDDSRIVRDVLKTVKDAEINLMIIVYTSDVNLIDNLTFLLKNMPSIKVKWTLFNIKVHEYAKLCLSTLKSESFQNKENSNMFYNYMSKSYKKFPEEISLLFLTRSETPQRVVSFVDFPNLEKSLEALEYRKSRLYNDHLVQRNGGFLKRRTVQNNLVEGWASTPYEDLCNLEDFRERSSKRIFKINESDIRNLKFKRASSFDEEEEEKFDEL